jgi:hypothetical protein
MPTPVPTALISAVKSIAMEWRQSKMPSCRCWGYQQVADAFVDPFIRWAILREPGCLTTAEKTPIGVKSTNPNSSPPLRR